MKQKYSNIPLCPAALHIGNTTICLILLMMWKARIVLSVIGQLIAVPAALFFMPTTYPKLFSTTTADSPEDVSAATFLEPTTTESSTLLADR